MSEGCDIVAEVIVGGATTVGPYYATTSCVYLPHTCPVMLPAAAYMELMQCSMAMEEVHKKAVAMGCEIVVEASRHITRIAVRDVRSATGKATETYRALNTMEGAMWLMRTLTGQP